MAETRSYPFTMTGEEAVGFASDPHGKYSQVPASQVVLADVELVSVAWDPSDIRDFTTMAAGAEAAGRVVFQPLDLEQN